MELGICTGYKVALTKDETKFIQNLKYIDFDGARVSQKNYEMIVQITARINLDMLANEQEIPKEAFRLFKLGIGQKVVKEEVEKKVDEKIQEILNKDEKL